MSFALDSFNFGIVYKYRDVFLNGVLTTIEIASVCLILSVIGNVGCRASSPRIIGAAAMLSPADTAWTYTLPDGHNAFAYVFEGGLTVGQGEDARPVARQELAVLGGGELLQLQAGAEGARLILVAGRPLREPVMRHGPFVMNTRQELMQAFVDFQEGRF